MSPEAQLSSVAAYKTEILLFFTLLQLAVIVLAGRLGGEMAVRVGQSAAVDEIIVGILLGPSLFGLVFPDMFHYLFRSAPPEPMQILSQIGLILLMFQIGLEFDFYTGLQIAGLDSAALWGWCALTVLLATVGKFGGAYGAARLAGLNRHEAKVLGILMNTRALMELVIINVGYDLGVISQNMFTMLVIMAVVSTVVTTPCLRAWLPRTGMIVPTRDNGVARRQI